MKLRLQFESFKVYVYKKNVKTMSTNREMDRNLNQVWKEMILF